MLQFATWQLTHYKSACSFNTQFHSKIKSHLSLYDYRWYCGVLKRYWLLPLNKHGNPVLSSQRILKFWNKTDIAQRGGKWANLQSQKWRKKDQPLSFCFFTNFKLVTPLLLKNVSSLIFHEAEKSHFRGKLIPRAYNCKFKSHFESTLLWYIYGYHIYTVTATFKRCIRLQSIGNL